METNIEKKVVDVDHTNFDWFVMVILSHGADGVVFGTDGEFEGETSRNCLKVEAIRKLVCGIQSLVDKPKLFFPFKLVE